MSEAPNEGESPQVPPPAIPAPATSLEKKHRFATRWYHWVNFPLLAIMIFSGLMIYWAYDPYRIGIGSFTLFHFFPDRFYQLTGLADAEGVGHLARGWRCA